MAHNAKHTKSQQPFGGCTNKLRHTSLLNIAVFRSFLASGLRNFWWCLWFVSDCSQTICSQRWGVSAARCLIPLLKPKRVFAWLSSLLRHAALAQDRYPELGFCPLSLFFGFCLKEHKLFHELEHEKRRLARVRWPASSLCR